MLVLHPNVGSNCVGELFISDTQTITTPVAPVVDFDCREGHGDDNGYDSDSPTGHRLPFWSQACACIDRACSWHRGKGADYFVVVAALF